MKTKITLLLTILLVFSSFAQQGINYKALIKDDIGNAIVNQDIDIRFTLQTLVGPTFISSYIEIHHTTTDSNGIATVAIGEGDEIIAGDFPDGYWLPNITLNLEIDIEQDGTYVDFGETSFKKVPMAIHADNVFSGDYNDLTNIPTSINATGLEYLDETDDGTANGGFVLIGREANNYGIVGEKAVDLSYSDFETSPERGATGENSFASGYLTNATGPYSTALGFSTNALGASTTTMGENLVASSNASTAIGVLNIDEPNSLFMIGNGYYGEFSLIQSNAFVVYRDGRILAPSLELNEITDDKSLITKEYLIINGSSGLEKITENGSTGWRFKSQNPDLYGPIGEGAVDLSLGHSSGTSGATGIESFAVGYNATASSLGSFASGSVVSATNGFSFVHGEQSQATGLYSTIFGFQNSATASFSFVSGAESSASGSGSSAMGRYNDASGEYSTARGRDNEASGDNSTAIGKNNEATGNNSTAIGLDTVASGQTSIALGDNTNASAPNSSAFGVNTNASGIRSTAMGSFTTASAMNSTAFGNNTTASGDNSTSMGSHTTAFSHSSTAIGRYSEIVSGLFIVGNGNSTSDRNNALVIKDNGDAKFDGEVQTTATGSANMIPIAYGSVSTTGSILGGSGNFTVTYNAGDTSYTIFVNNESVTASNSAGMVTVNTSTFRSANTTYDGVNMIAHIFLANGNKVQSPFQFVIYKN